MKRGLFIILICFSIMLISPITAKADLVFESEDEISSIYEEESEDAEEEASGILLVIGGLVLVIAVITGILIWIFYGKKRKS